MRILYGVHTQGQGGLARAGVLISILERWGHTVRVVTSGIKPPASYQFSRHTHFQGMEYVVSRGQTDYLRTFVKWTRELPRLGSSLLGLQRVLDQFDPELVLSDFEPLTANPLLRVKCERLAVSRPAALIDPGVRIPQGHEFERRMVRTVIRLFTSGADRRLGYHLEPSTYRCLPPVIDDEVRRMRPVQGDHLLVYNVYHTQAGKPSELVGWASHNRVRVIAYGFPEVGRRGRVGWVDFRPASRQDFLNDVASSRAVITTAGMGLPLEAALLGKPVSVVPIPGQWEQFVNAYHLQNAGLAQWLDHWDYSAALDQPCRLEVPSPWLSQSPEAVLARIIPSLQDHIDTVPTSAQSVWRVAA